MTILKNFKQYTPEDAESIALIQEVNALFIRSEDGTDWYEAQKSFDPNLLKVVFNADTGVIISADTDVSVLWPIDACIADVDYNVNAQVEDLQGKVFDVASGTIIDRVFNEEEMKAKLTAQVAYLQKQASELIAPLTYAVDLEVITEEENAYLKALKLYSIALIRVEQQDGYPFNVELPNLPTK